MIAYKKILSLTFIFMFLFSSVGTSTAHAYSAMKISTNNAMCEKTRYSSVPVLKEVIIDEDGNLSAYASYETDFAESLELVFTNEDEKVLWRAPVKTFTKAKSETIKREISNGEYYEFEVKTGEIRLSKRDIEYLSDDMLVRLEVMNFKTGANGKREEADSCGYITWESNLERIYFTEGHKENTIPSKTKELEFPGYVKIREGSIQIVINLIPEYEKAKFTLLVLNENGKVIKRIPVQTKNPTISSKQLSLPEGTYTVQLEMTLGSKKTVSKSVEWVISPPKVEFTIPSGANFPGSVTVNSNGTIKVTIKVSSSYHMYEYYLVVVDVWSNEVRRIAVNPSNVIQNLNLKSGGYTIYIEVIDPETQDYAQSLSTFYTVNTTGQIIVFIDGQMQTYSRPPVKMNSRVLVPMRAVFEAFGARVDWDEATQSVTATRGNDVVHLTIGSKIAYKNGQQIIMDVPAILYNDETTMVPIRFVSEALGAIVSWDGYSNSVIISND
jgi:Copper amine oxidase N-terminal domain